MSHGFNTLELAGIYEKQGYFQDAFEIYQALAKESGKKDELENSSEINAGLRRMELALQNQATPEDKALDSSDLPNAEKKIERLLEQWLMLMVLDKRFELIKQVKSKLE
ncbi:MAG: hypothetical protein GY710_25320 [Desulfobacteraceae bacterium]|nr:hypothetical protein [Desulfobacteraceae bacterium]